jgi:ketosteroid isomerase-like protein
MFHDHFNAGRRDEVLAMATDDVAIGGARGKGAGKQLLNEWVGRATTTMQPQRWFLKDDTVVIEELIEWRSRDGDRVTDSTIWGLAFTVRDGKIASLARYAGIGEAVYEAGLDASHEAKWPTHDPR